MKSGHFTEIKDLANAVNCEMFLRNEVKYLVNKKDTIKGTIKAKLHYHNAYS